MTNRIAALLFILALLPVGANAVTRELHQSVDERDRPKRLRIDHAEDAALDYFLTVTNHAGNAVNWSGMQNPVLRYYGTNSAGTWTEYVTGTIHSATSGVLKIPFRPLTTATNGSFPFEISVPSNSVDVWKYPYGQLYLRAIPGGGSTNVIPSTTNVTDLAGTTFINYPWYASTNLDAVVLTQATQQVTIDALVTTQAALQVSIASLATTSSIAALQATVNANITTNAAQQTSIDALVTTQAALQVTADALVTTSAAQQTSIDGLVSTQATLRADADSLIGGAFWLGSNNTASAGTTQDLVAVDVDTLTINETLTYTNEWLTLDPADKCIRDSNPANKAIDWSAYALGYSGVTKLDWNNCLLNNNTPVTTLNWLTLALNGFWTVSSNASSGAHIVNYRTATNLIAVGDAAAPGTNGLAQVLAISGDAQGGSISNAAAVYGTNVYRISTNGYAAQECIAFGDAAELVNNARGQSLFGWTNAHPTLTSAASMRTTLPGTLWTNSLVLPEGTNVIGQYYYTNGVSTFTPAGGYDLFFWSNYEQVGNPVVDAKVRVIVSDGTTTNELSTTDWVLLDEAMLERVAHAHIESAVTNDSSFYFGVELLVRRTGGASATFYLEGGTDARDTYMGTPSLEPTATTWGSIEGDPTNATALTLAKILSIGNNAAAKITNVTAAVADTDVPQFGQAKDWSAATNISEVWNANLYATNDAAYCCAWFGGPGFKVPRILNEAGGSTDDSTTTVAQVENAGPWLDGATTNFVMVWGTNNTITNVAVTIEATNWAGFRILNYGSSVKAARGYAITSHN